MSATVCRAKCWLRRMIGASCRWRASRRAITFRLLRRSRCTTRMATDWPGRAETGTWRKESGSLSARRITGAASATPIRSCAARYGRKMRPARVEPGRARIPDSQLLGGFGCYKVADDFPFVALALECDDLGEVVAGLRGAVAHGAILAFGQVRQVRSEERRVGEGCGWRRVETA